MKAYGYTRRAKISCRFGCCQRNDARKDTAAREVNDRKRRKAARQEGKRKIFTDLFKDKD